MKILSVEVHAAIISQEAGLDLGVPLASQWYAGCSIVCARLLRGGAPRDRVRADLRFDWIGGISGGLSTISEAKKIINAANPGDQRQ